jgi:predicted Rossmann fold nucleotide-binding protein DprA/Smf involved in DNA uptake
MKTYRVSAIYTQEQLLKFLDENRTVDVTIEVLTPAGDDVRHARHVSPPPALPRRSKVVDTILAALNDGMKDVAALKGALMDAGMSRNSLSTGLAILQKSGKISRDANGYYYAHEELVA